MHLNKLNENACNFEEMRQALVAANANFAKLQAEIDALKGGAEPAAPAAPTAPPAAGKAARPT